jgi:hypothetical protein
MTQKETCPRCGGVDLDHWPATSKFAYCYTCQESVQMVVPKQTSASSKSSEPLRVVPKDKPQSVRTLGAKPDSGILLTDSESVEAKEMKASK